MEEFEEEELIEMYDDIANEATEKVKVTGRYVNPHNDQKGNFKIPQMDTVLEGPGNSGLEAVVNEETIQEEKRITWADVVRNVKRENVHEETIDKDEADAADEQSRTSIATPRSANNDDINQRSAIHENQRSANTDKVEKMRNDKRVPDILQNESVEGDEIRSMVQHRYNTRSKKRIKKRNYNHRFNRLEDK